MEKLYKYTRINDNTVSALIEGYAWYPKPSTLNDPFDCGLSGSLWNGDDQWGVLSLSELNSNIMMWSHYADSHRGLCIEYTDYTDEQLTTPPFSSEINAFNAELDELPIIRNASPVKYLTTDEIGKWLHDLPQSFEDFNAALRSYNDGPMTPEKYSQGFVVREMQALFLKHQDWSYEKEYRIVVNEGNKPVYAPGVVTTLLLGMKTTDTQCQSVYRIGKSIGANVLKMERVPREYRLIPRELTESEMVHPNPDSSRAINGHLRKQAL